MICFFLSELDRISQNWKGKNIFLKSYDFTNVPVTFCNANLWIHIYIHIPKFNCFPLRFSASMQCKVTVPNERITQTCIRMVLNTLQGGEIACEKAL